MQKNYLSGWGLFGSLRLGTLIMMLCLAATGFGQSFKPDQFYRLVSRDGRVATIGENAGNNDPIFLSKEKKGDLQQLWLVQKTAGGATALVTLSPIWVLTMAISRLVKAIRYCSGHKVKAMAISSGKLNQLAHQLPMERFF
ncbi:hypothetical protein FSB73_23035 [Arachidicoccus ginsenosidivorans]|uniref:Uncharacterized protein n=1 Tax=Arachidicoccus ginsenosidivorans TaxID=496057 RepID=A0A5B8VS58_9BACT|nr:hypothetical protein [Arachidicoccus ginsenosidivorans]QEC74113.1 hypothetical protein FSB73_23035 [Arachidicoccus ginsenosidivorans]